MRDIDQCDNDSHGIRVMHFGLDGARRLLLQSKHWLQQSMQDTNSLFAFQHACFALAYMNAARSQSHDGGLERSTSTDIQQHVRKVETQFEVSSKRLAKGRVKLDRTSWVQ